eukprot:scaffold20835_cov21-Tisochrysis_lutea.AAC.1
MEIIRMGYVFTLKHVCVCADNAQCVLPGLFFQVVYDENGVAVGVSSEGETAKAKMVVGSPEYFPQKVRNVGKVVRAIAFLVRAGIPRVSHQVDRAEACLIREPKGVPSGGPDKGSVCDCMPLTHLLVKSKHQHYCESKDWCVLCSKLCICARHWMDSECAGGTLDGMEAPTTFV